MFIAPPPLLGATATLCGGIPAFRSAAEVPALELAPLRSGRGRDGE
jgi:hypothetical protein